MSAKKGQKYNIEPKHFQSVYSRRKHNMELKDLDRTTRKGLFIIKRIHQWINYNYGKASKCENKDCGGKSKTFDYSLLEDKFYDYVRENYMQLCRSCHFKYDYKNGKFEKQKQMFCRIGKKYAAENGKVMRSLTYKQAEIIREKHRNGMFQSKLADMFSVSINTISLIIRNKTYAND